jgi:uridine kinase
MHFLHLIVGGECAARAIGANQCCDAFSTKESLAVHMLHWFFDHRKTDRAQEVIWDFTHKEAWFHILIRKKLQQIGTETIGIWNSQKKHANWELELRAAARAKR